MLARDRRKYDQRGPKWSESSRDKKKADENNKSKYPKRCPGKPEFVMDMLSRYLLRCVAEAFDKAKHILQSFNRTKDPHLFAPYQDAERRAIQLESAGSRRLRQELDAIEAHVKRVKQLHQDKIGYGFTKKPIEVRQDVLRALSTAFSLPSLSASLKKEPFKVSNKSDPPVAELIAFSADEAQQVMASFAYIHDWNKSGKCTRFPYDVAFEKLCRIKAEAVGGQTILQEHYLTFAVHRMYQPTGVE